jgi:hypothetical protein
MARIDMIVETADLLLSGDPYAEIYIDG